MADENVREIGKPMEDFHGRALPVGVSYGNVTIGHYELSRRQCLAFGRRFMAAYGAAAAYAARNEEDEAALGFKWCGVCDTAGHASGEHDAQAAVDEILDSLRTRLASGRDNS